MEEKSLKINQETMDILVANVIPTTKYFESQFLFLQHQINEMRENQKKFELSVSDRFEQVDKRFEQIDKRFEQVDKRFEQVDARFEQVDRRFEQIHNDIHNLAIKIEQLTKSNETTMRDYIIERDRHYDNKFNNLRMFNITIAFGMAGVIAKLMNIF
jgi:methyl-accepting chemotaxis protein